jgi:hypothetical protein
MAVLETAMTGQEKLECSVGIGGCGVEDTSGEVNCDVGGY